MSTIADAWGDNWLVYDSRHTAHGFELYLGRPIPAERGGTRTIITAELLDRFESLRRTPKLLDLPIGATAIKRIRNLLGHNRYLDAAAWWDERLPDLMRLTAERFAAKHDVNPGAVVNARLKLLGKRQRPGKWWRSNEVIALLAAPHVATVDAAEALDVSVATVRRLRQLLIAEGAIARR